MNDQIIIIDKDNLETIKNNLEPYINEEQMIINDFNDSYLDIKEIYKSVNNDTLDKYESEIIMNMNTINTNHRNNLYLIDKRIEKVINTVIKVKEIDESVRGDTINNG